MKLTQSGCRISLTTITDEHMLPIHTLCKSFHTNQIRGLSCMQAKAILKESGKNTFQPPATSIRYSFRGKMGSTCGGKFTKAEWQRLVGERIPLEVCVVRDGQKRWISGKKLVPGDVVVLKKQDFVPADIRIFNSNELIVDNRLINGNRAQVKMHGVYCEDSLLSPNMLFCCTKIVEGSCVGVVLRTGEDTVFGALKNYATRVRFDALMPPSP